LVAWVLMCKPAVGCRWVGSLGLRPADFVVILETGMTKVLLTPRPTRARVLSCVLLGGFLLLTSGPVCGSLTDVDPAACCKRHGCRQSMPSRRSVSCATESAGRHICSDAGEGCSSNSTAEDCCHRGNLAYPVVGAQSSLSFSASHVTALLVVANASVRRPATVSVTCRLRLPVSPPLLIPLYSLHSTYRI
jgi:hypothetical protein